MKIALIGYGKMGKVIEQIALERGHEIVLRITSANRQDMTADALRGADVAIEFTGPHAAAANVRELLAAGVATVSGSTGWNDGLQEVRDLAVAGGAAFLHASNFSVGVNIFFEINKLLARLMKGRNEYSPAVEETHHVHKRDTPGGTAITIAEQMIQALGNKTGWTLNDASLPDALPIYAHRVGEVPGTHKVTYTSAVDDIEIIHTAHNRQGFALGAVLAAEYVAGKKGVFSMKDVLGI
ncbi:4-hydroxy-tetrahydrodipicolinate reductase [Nemorincola caseinilytica]|uniref:4-hydroxy-tetrahydrodipicolinate reductase n=1 Tax=Nemorincola caseinilytica TaxID=2054315 RepID=A0ABP8NCK0_9BACT